MIPFLRLTNEAYERIWQRHLLTWNPDKLWGGVKYRMKPKFFNVNEFNWWFLQKLKYQTGWKAKQKLWKPV